MTRDDNGHHDTTRQGGVDPAPLDYFAPGAPQRVAPRAMAVSTILLLVSWIPYVCGVVNAAASARSYVPAITSVHVNTSVALLAVGLALSIASLVRFTRARQYPGAISAGVVVVVQAMLAGCLGLS